MSRKQLQTELGAYFKKAMDAYDGDLGNGGGDRDDFGPEPGALPSPNPTPRNPPDAPGTFTYSRRALAEQVRAYFASDDDETETAKAGEVLTPEEERERAEALKLWTTFRILDDDGRPVNAPCIDYSRRKGN